MTRRVIVELRDDAPEWALIDIAHSIEDGQTREIYGKYIRSFATEDDE